MYAIARNEIYPITTPEFGFGVGFVDLNFELGLRIWKRDFR